MCGFAGLWSADIHTALDLDHAARRMSVPLAHRGPDDSGAWVDPGAGFGVGFRRLAILDVTPLGHQPMLSASGRYVLAFNGEIYNFVELRRDLEQSGATFVGNSDTEVVLAGFERW